MATTEVDTAEATPLTTLQKMEVEDQELVTGESDKSVDQLSKDELNKIEMDLTKVLETVERSGDGDDTEAVQVQSDAGVRACDAGAQESGRVAEGGIFVKTPSVPEVADEKTCTESHVDVEPSDHLLHPESLKEVETQDRVNNSGDESKQEEDADKEIASLSEKADGKECSCESEKEVGVSADQVQEDAVVEVEKELEKSPETKDGEVSILERQAEVCTDLESVPTVSTKDSEREKPVHVSEIRETATSTDSLKEGVENELPSAIAQPEEKTTDSVQVEEKNIISEISTTEEEPEQAISLKDDPVVEKLEISSENISEDTGEADPSDIADKTIPHVEEEKTIIEQQTDDSETNANERRASDGTSVELEKSQVSITTRACPAEDVETEKADAAQVTEEASDLEGVHAVEDSREVDVASVDSFTTEVDDKSPDAKTEEASSPSSNTEHLLQKEESKPAKTDKIVEQVNEEPTSTCADDDRVKEQTNMVGHILTGSHGEDVTAPLDDKEENSNKKEISEQVIQEFSKIEEEPVESTHKREIGIPETSPNSTSEEPGEAVESDHVDGITITTTGEETDKIEGQGTDSTEFKMNSALAEAKGRTEVAEAEILGEDAETNKEEKTEILEKDGVNKASLTVTADDSGSELPSPAQRDLKETSIDEEDSEQPEQINETPEILEQVTVETPAEIKEGAPGKDEDIHVSISEDETVKKVEQIEERHKGHPANDCETEAVGDTGADVSDATEDEVVTIKEQGSAGSTEVKSGTVTDQHLQKEEKQDPIEPTAELVEKEAELTGNFEERVAGNGTQLDEPIALESQMQTHGIEEVPARVEQIAETFSQEQTENKVESKPESVSEPNLDDSNSQEKISEPDQDDTEKLKKTSEPDPDDAENPKQVSEPKPDDSENLKKTSEPDPDDAENPKQVSEPKPDDSENLKKTSEPDPDDAENPKQVSEPDPEDCENLEKVLEKVQDDSEELKQVAEPDPDDSETLKQVSEPDPDNSGSKEKVSEPNPDVSENLEKVSEPDPDDSENVKKISGPDPDDTEILDKFSEPDPDDSQNQKIVPEADPDDSENQEKVDTTEIPEDCDEATKKEIPVSTSEEVPEKTDATPGEATFSEVSTVGVADERVSRSIEVITAIDTVPELSVEDSVQEEDRSYQIPETGNEEHKQESAPTPTTDDQTTLEQIIKGDAEQDEEPASEGGSPPADVTVESKKPDEAEEDMEKIDDSGASAEQDDAEIPVTAAECNKSHVEEVKEQITEEVSQKDEAGEEASVKENEPGEAVEHLANADDETEPSTSSVNDDEVTILNTKEAPEDPELSTPSLNDDNITSLKSDESAEEIQEEEEKVDVSDKETVKEVLMPEDEQKDTNAAHETEDSEPSALSVNDDSITSQKGEKSTEETQEEQEKVAANVKETAKEVLVLEDEQKHENVPDETKDTEASASSINDDNITSQKSEEGTKEIPEEQQKDDVNAEDKETAKEVSVLEDEQKDSNAANETEDTVTSASSVNNDNITSQESEERAEEILGEQQKDDAIAEDKETAKEMLVPKDEQDTNLANETEVIKPSASSVNDDNITSQKSEMNTAEIQEEQDKVDDKETVKEVLVLEDEQKDTNVPNETEDAEPSASSVNAEKITSQESEESTKEILGEQKKDDVNAEEREISEVLMPDDEQKDTNVPNETEDTEPSASSANDDNIASLESEERAEENLEEQHKDHANAEEKETAKEILVPENEQRDTNVANETEETEPSASSVNDDNITSQKSEESTEEIQEEQQRDDVKPAEKESAKDVLVQEDEQDTNVPDKAEHTEPSDKITSLKSEERTEDTPEEQQKDSVSAIEKETVVEVLVPEDEQKDKKVSNDTEDAEQPASSVNDGELSLDKGEELPGEVIEKQIDQAKDDDNVEEKQTADEVVVQDEDHAQPSQLPNEPKGNEPSLSVNDEDISILKREEIQGEASLEDNQNVAEDEITKEATVRQEEQGEEEKVHLPNEAEDNGVPAASADDDNFTTVKTEEIQEEGKDKDQAEDNDKREIAPEVTEQDDGREEQLALLQSETKEAEPSSSAPIANDNEIAIPRSLVDPETVMETNQVNDDGNSKEVETTKEALVQESKGVELEHLPKESGEVEPGMKDESASVLNSKKEPEEKETDLVRDDMEEEETAHEALRQEDAGPLDADAGDDKTASLKIEGVLEEATEESNQSDRTEPEVKEVKEKEHVDRELVLEDEQREDAKDEPTASLVNKDDIKTLKSEESPEEIQEEQKEAKQNEDDGDAKATETANEALVADIPLEKVIDLAKEMVEAESPAPNPSADETVILKMEEGPKGVTEEDKKKDQIIDDEVTANELPVQENEKEDEPEHLPSETEGAELQASRVTDDKLIGVDSGEKTEQGAEELVERSQEKVDETEEREPSNEGLESSVDELEAGHAQSKTHLESKEPDSIEDNAEKEDSIAEDTNSPDILEDKVESGIQENEHIKAVHEEAATTNESQVFDKLHEASVEKDIEEETTVPEALAAEAKSSDDDNKGLTETETHQDGDTWESVASVEVSNAEAHKDFVTTAKETAEEELESIKPDANEEDKKELTITEAQGKKLESSDQDEVPVLRDENQDANEPVTTDTDGTTLQFSETAEVPAAADEDQVDVTPREAGDEEPLESPASREAEALGDEDQKDVITASDEATEKTANECLITSGRECDFQPTDDADEKVDVPSESLTSSSILEEAKSIITGKDTETIPPNDKALVESEDKVEDIAVRESQAKENDETFVKADTSAGSNAAGQAAISSLVLEKDDETQMEIEGDVNAESIKETSSLGLQHVTVVTSEVSDESVSIVEPVAEDEIATKENSGSTEELAISEGNNPEHLTSEVPKSEVDAAEAVEIKEELLMEEASLVPTPPGLTEQEGQEESVQVVTLVSHTAEPDEEIETKEQCRDSADEIVNAPVKLQDEPETSREPAGDEKVKEVSSTELDKEENKGQSEIQIEAPDSAIPEKLEVKEAHPQKTATVTPANDKLEVDQVIKSEASNDPIELEEKKGGPDPAETVISGTASRDREADFRDEEVVVHQSKSGTVQADDSVATLAVPQQEQASSKATLGTAVNEGNNPEHLSSEVPKPEVNAVEAVEIKEELLMEEASLVTAPPCLAEQEGQEKPVPVVTSVSHTAEPDEEIETNEQCRDSPDEILSAPVKLQDKPNASQEPAGYEKVEDVSSTELDKEENKGQSEIQIEAPDSAIPEKLEVKEAQPQETATVAPANDKLDVDQVIKSEASEDPIESAEKKGGPDPAETVTSSIASRDREADFLDEEVAHQSKSGTAQADDCVATLAVPKQEQASSEPTLRADTDAEASPILVSTANKDVPAETQQSTTRSLDYAEVARPEIENAGRGEIQSQSRSAEVEKTKTAQEIDSKTDSAILPLNIPAENSLSDLLQISTKDTVQMAQQPSQETDPAPKKEDPHTEGPKTDEDKDDEEEEEGEEQKKTDSNSSDGVIVEGSRDLDVKPPHKKHGILSGVGSKVKNSISKVKKAITGKSSHPKP